jgi:murein DD-endopeptidase MepM/ murein hydrolase activator NlpD
VEYCAQCKQNKDLMVMKKKGYSSVPKELHFVIAGETGTVFSFVVRRNRLALVAGSTLFVFSLLAAGSWLGAGFFHEKTELAVKAALQAEELVSLRSDRAAQLEKEIALRERSWQKAADEQDALLVALRQERDGLIKAFEEEKEHLVCRYEEELAAVSASGSARISDLAATLERERQDKQNLLEKTAGRLDERSRMIESLMSRIGIEVKVGKKKEKADASSGGPFIAASVDASYSEELLQRSDKYIKTIRQMPLGLPMKGRVTSGFGRRSDPFNHRPAFHGGIDFKGSIGDKVMATADGVVKETGFDRNGFGNYVILNHGNGYETLFGHLSKISVQQGGVVGRGDIVGLMGNSGRSTGPHLHYEVHWQGKAVDPKKYLSVADLSFTVPM